MPEAINNSLVRISKVDGWIVGAGFLVGKCHVLTCAHVVAQALDLPEAHPDPPLTPVVLDFPLLNPHTRLEAKVIFWCPVSGDGSGDIAGLELLGDPPEGAQMVHFAPAEDVWDHPFRAFGFPKGHDGGGWATGRLLGRQADNWLMLEDVKTEGFPVERGFSGSPVWDEKLQSFVGMIVTASQPTTTKTAFVIPSDVLINSWPDLASLMRPLVPHNPYKGLRHFTEQDAPYFFGRESLTDELTAALETALTRQRQASQQTNLLVAVLGPSGSGKSSVVRAGLLPCLRAGGVFNSDEWVYLDPVIPGEHPLKALAGSLVKQLSARDVTSIHNDLVSGPAYNLHLLICQLGEICAKLT